MSDILAIVSNFARPQNLPPIIAALRGQSVPVDIVVVDNSPADESAFFSQYIDTCGGMAGCNKGFDILRFTENAGPPCRFAPAFMEHSHEFIWFLDDDLAPGSQAVETLLQCYEWVDGQCSTIGEIGRVHTDSGEYVKRNIRRFDHPRRVDMTARSHFVRTENMRHVLSAKWRLIDRFGDEAKQLVSVHDDLLLCCGIQFATCHPSYLTANNAIRETLTRKQDLPDGGGGVSAKTGFLGQRHRLIQMFQAIGWRSLV